MNQIINYEKINIDDMIYEIRGKQVMLSSKISATKWHDYLYDKIVTHTPILMLINFADVSAKLERSQKIW